MEKHWKSVISRSVCDYFFEAQKKIPSPADMPAVVATPHHYLLTIFRNNLYFVAVTTTEGKLRALPYFLNTEVYRVNSFIPQ